MGKSKINPEHITRDEGVRGPIMHLQEKSKGLQEELEILWKRYSTLKPQLHPLQGDRKVSCLTRGEGS